MSFINFNSTSASAWLCNIEAHGSISPESTLTCFGHPLTFNASSTYYNNLDPCVCFLNVLVLSLPLMSILQPPRLDLPLPRPPPILPNPQATFPPVPDIPEASPNPITPEELSDIFPDVAGDPSTCNVPN